MLKRNGRRQDRAKRDSVAEVHCVIGTRPEAIKMAPVVHALLRDPEFAVRVICTGQHRELLDDLLPVLGLRADRDFELMSAGQTVADTVGRAVVKLGAFWHENRPQLVLVQGDTATALGAALAAYYERIAVGHVEAGLRTFDPTQPFPEETNRVLISRVAGLHFCPTLANRDNLLTEGVPQNHIFVTGNTGIDCFLGFWKRENVRIGTSNDGPRTILVTAHRRENADGPFVEICRALVTIAEMGLGARVVFPVHPNPVLRRTAERYLKNLSNVEVVAPLRYDRFVSVLAGSLLIVTDSGGIQEEACTVGKPALVLRNVTERQEGVATGSTRVIGTRRDVIVREVTRLLSDDAALAALSRPTRCFGDGAASGRIVQGIRHMLFGARRPADFVPSVVPALDAHMVAGAPAAATADRPGVPVVAHSV